MLCFRRDEHRTCQMLEPTFATVKKLPKFAAKFAVVEER